MTADNPLRHPVCSRDGLGLSPKKGGGWKHNGGRWTSASCGKDPDPVEYVAYLEANPWKVYR